MLYSAGHTIDPTTGTITAPEGGNKKLRPRTFSLLLLFLERAGENLSKQDILNHVWSDVVVGEHVVFQSIKEIRQAFGPLDVIKTIPKKGYTWLEPVSDEDTPQSDGHEKQALKRQNYYTTFIASLCAVLFIAFGWFITQPAHSVSGSILILPVSSRLDDPAHRWVRLGAMDQMIQNLASSRRSGVLHTDSVLEVMARADITAMALAPSDLQSLFTVSGAGLIVESQLAGSPQDYQLHYTLHQRNGSTKGVIFAREASSAFKDLALTIAQKSDLELTGLPSQYTSGFANELIANALLARYDNNMEATVHLLEAAVASEQGNITAKRLLLETLLKRGETARTETLLEETFLQLAMLEKPSREHVSVHYFAAINALRSSNTSKAQGYLDDAETLATNLNEWLYLAYISETRGLIAQEHRNFEEAGALFQQARRFHRVLQCPFGESRGLLYLSSLAFQQDQYQVAEEYLARAQTLIKERNLTALQVQAMRLEQSLRQ